MNMNSETMTDLELINNEEDLEDPIAPAVVGATVAVIGFGYTIFKDIIGNKGGDVRWNLGHMKGAKYPWDDKSTYHNKGTWRKKSFLVKRKIENRLFDEISATFEVEYWYNGHAVGFVTVDNTRANDAVGWSLDVESRVTVDPNTYQSSTGKLYSAVFIRFNYKFDRALGSPVIRRVKYKLRGTGRRSRG